MAKTVTVAKVKRISKPTLLARITPFLDTFEFKLRAAEGRKSVEDITKLLKKRGYSKIHNGYDGQYDDAGNEAENGLDNDIWVKAYELNRDTGVLEESESVFLESHAIYSVVALPAWSDDDDSNDDPYSADCSEGLIRTKKEEWSGLGLFEGGTRMSSTELYNHIFQNRN